HPADLPPSGYDRPVRRRPGYPRLPDVRRIILLQLVLLAAAAAASCGRGDVAAPAPAAAAVTKPSAPSVPRSPTSSAEKTTDIYDLAADEALGGHTLQRHVGRAFAQLAERVLHERQIFACST